MCIDLVNERVGDVPYLYGMQSQRLVDRTHQTQLYRILMRNLDQQRRRFILDSARSLLGLSVLCNGLRAQEATPQFRGTAKNVISIFLNGGLSHIDSFDPKPESSKVQGPVDVISTAVAGLQFTEWLPGLAKAAGDIAVVRSMHHSQGNHEPGTYKMWTGYQRQNGVTHPSLGSWIGLLRGSNTGSLPGYVKVGSLAGHPLNGFLESRYAPMPVTNPREGIKNASLRGDRTMAQLNDDLGLAREVDRTFRQRHSTKAVRSYAALYDEAVRMMVSDDLDAFDLSNEPATVREQYGDNPFGQGALLARRLTERGVAFVELSSGGFDTHLENHKTLAEKIPPVDHVVATLIEDLKRTGRLDSTLVVVSTEFGRSPQIDEYGGRNHHPIAFSVMLAGGGVRGGQVFGKTDENGREVVDDVVTPWDLNTTIAMAMGLNAYEMHAPGPQGQKFSVAGKDTQPEKGRFLDALFG